MKRTGQDSRPTRRFAFNRQKALGLLPKACTVSWTSVMFPTGATPGRRSRATRAAFFCDWYTTCSSSNLPSSEYAGQDCQGESPLVEWSCDTVHFSLIDPNRPQRTEFIRMHDAHLEPLRRDHVRTKLPVRPTYSDWPGLRSWRSPHAPQEHGETIGTKP